MCDVKCLIYCLICCGFVLVGGFVLAGLVGWFVAFGILWLVVEVLFRLWVLLVVYAFALLQCCCDCIL